uniref:Nucleoside diphosphate kinase B n=1 Tax=Lates calcarifer TaxID=8187 RepID=A0A4W6BRC8_LATCA
LTQRYKCTNPKSLHGPMRAYILAREDAIRHWRELMGPTKVFRARYTSPASIRIFKLIFLFITSLDSVESAQREISFFFPDFCVEEWMEKDEPLFICHCVKCIKVKLSVVVTGTIEIHLTVFNTTRPS